MLLRCWDLWDLLLRYMLLRGRLGVLKVHTGKIDSLWNLAKQFVPSNLQTKAGQNKDVMLYLRCWQWRYEGHNGKLLSKTASKLKDRWADDGCVKNSSNPHLMHVVFAGNSQNSIDFASTFFDQNSIIKRVRNSILYCKLQVILTLLETNNQNARAVSLPPGCLRGNI